MVEEGQLFERVTAVVARFPFMGSPFPYLFYSFSFVVISLLFV